MIDIEYTLTGDDTTVVDPVRSVEPSQPLLRSICLAKSIGSPSFQSRLGQGQGPVC